MSISQENLTKAQAFMTAINAILYIVEEIAPSIPEGQYLEMMNALGNIYNFRPANIIEAVQTLRTNPLVVHMDRQTRMEVRKSREIMDDASKLKSGYKVCPLCDVIVDDLRKHQDTKKCRDAVCAKRLAISTRTLDNSNLKMGLSLLKATKLKKALVARNKPS